MAVTQFEIDNALMAGRAYFDTRASINRFPVPQGWAEFNHRALDSGFEATSTKSVPRRIPEASHRASMPTARAAKPSKAAGSKYRNSTPDTPVCLICKLNK